MALFIYDQGYRVQTPKESLFPKRGVNSLTKSKESHQSAGSEDKLHADGDKFVIPGQPQPQERNENSATRAYTSHSTTEHKSSEAPTARLTVANLMVSPVHTVQPGTTIHTAWKRLDSLEINHLIVVDDNNRPVGLVSRSDLQAAGKDSIHPVKSVYSGMLIAATPETLIQDIAINFIDNDINAVPVVDTDDRVVGIICRTDLLRLLVSGPHLERWV